MANKLRHPLPRNRIDNYYKITGVKEVIMNPALKWLVPLIFILTLIAALSGVWPAQGMPYPLTNFRGEQVTINARGLYY